MLDPMKNSKLEMQVLWIILKVIRKFRQICDWFYFRRKPIP
jgi:hypothetical protein